MSLPSLLEGLPYQVSLLLHIAAGCVVLACFWTAAIARKGARVHRTAGKGFMLAMCVVLVTGLPLTAQRFATGNAGAGLFLGYLFVITGNACWVAWRAVQDKKDWRVMVARPAWRAWIALCLGTGLLVLAVGLRAGSPLLIGFSIIGPVIAVRMWQFRRRGPTRSNWHVVTHYQGILGAGVATHVAFLAVGMAQVWPRVAKIWPALPQTLVDLFPWFAPLIVAAVALVVLNSRYARIGRPLVAAVSDPI